MRLMTLVIWKVTSAPRARSPCKTGAKVVHCEDTIQALGALRNGKGADLIMIDIKQKIREFIDAIKAERINIPVIACGIGELRQSVARFKIA